MATCDVAIVGAGPYGLSAAAHLNSGGKNVRVFGECMGFWERHMPAGMFLRSPWGASNLSDPSRKWTLDAYKAFSGNHLSAPVPLDRFVDYGRWFKQNAVPNVDSRRVTRIEPQSEGFSLILDDGEALTAPRVIVASGILPFAWWPPQFKDLSPDLVSHSSQYRDLSRFSGQSLVVIGAGQSALESAALLREVGANVEVVIRNPAVIWLHQKPLLHTWPLSAILYAWPDVGPALLSHIVARPDWFKSLPRNYQDKWGLRAIRPAGAQWLKPRVQNVLPVTTGRSVKSAARLGNELKLTLDDGSERKVNHVLLATGYRVNIALYPFLSEKLLRAIRCVDGYPRLDGGLESSVPGLHFLGAPAAWSFGPLMRFVAGAEYATRALARKILGETVKAS
jgi:FAD-dependent urate hydroxylase